MHFKVWEVTLGLGNTRKVLILDILEGRSRGHARSALVLWWRGLLCDKRQLVFLEKYVAMRLGSIFKKKEVGFSSNACRLDLAFVVCHSGFS